MWYFTGMADGAREDRRTLVMKFGGTSVGDAEAMARAVAVAREAKKSWPRVVVVTSAMTGVTDLLLQSAAAAVKGGDDAFTRAAEELTARHTAALETLVKDLAARERVRQELLRLVQDFLNLCAAIAVLGEATPRALDAVGGLGERLCVKVLTAALGETGLAARGVEATRLILTDDHFQSAHPDLAKSTILSRSVLKPLLDAGEVPVVTGFIGATATGATTTLGRGGSDYSAALLGAILPADDVWIWTDVDGVMTADPRFVPEARSIPELSYREVAELAYFGAKVLHPNAIRPVIDANIGLRVCNTFNPGHPGTRIVSDSKPRSNGIIKAVTTIRGLSLVTLEGRGMLGVPGVAARTFAAVASTGVSVPLITQASSEQSICFAIPLEAAGRVCAKLEAAFAREIQDRDIDGVSATGEVDIISVVGAGMRSTPGVAGRVFTALGDRKVNVIAVAQGSSEVSISLVVRAEDAGEAVRALHGLIGDEKGERT